MPSPLDARLRTALRDARRARDRVAVAALGSAVGALDTAGAVPVEPRPASAGVSQHFAGASAGVGATEAPRRELEDAEVQAIVQAEIDERSGAAAAAEAHGRAEVAAELRAEAAVLTALL